MIVLAPSVLAKSSLAVIGVPSGLGETTQGQLPGGLACDAENVDTVVQLLDDVLSEVVNPVAESVITSVAVVNPVIVPLLEFEVDWLTSVPAVDMSVSDCVSLALDVPLVEELELALLDVVNVPFVTLV